MYFLAMQYILMKETDSCRAYDNICYHKPPDYSGGRFGCFTAGDVKSSCSIVCVCVVHCIYMDLAWVLYCLVPCRGKP